MAKRKADAIIDFSNGPHISHRALETVLLKAHREGIPEAVSRTTQWRARKADNILTPHGRLLEEIVVNTTKGDAKICTQNPAAMFYFACTTPGFRRLMRETIAKNPIPWHIVYYNDEVGVSPLGNDTRKSEATYWTFREFGANLSQELLWFVLASIRSSVVKTFSGGCSALAGLLLGVLFGSLGPDFRTGITIDLGDGPFVFTAILDIIVMDEDALKKAFMCKGASGIIPCMFCKNLVKLGSDLLANSAYLRPITCLNAAEIEPHTDESIHEIIKLLSDAAAAVTAKTMTKAAFEDMEIYLGFNHHPNNFLAIKTLDIRPISQIMIDWFHTYCVTGLFNYEWAILMRFLLEATPISWDMVQQFAEPWTHPRTMTNPAYTLTSSSISDETFHFKCSGGEALSLVPVLGQFLEVIVKPMGSCCAQVDSMLCCFDAMELLQRTPTGEVSPELLGSAVTKHLEAYQTAYGTLGWVWKHHASSHLAWLLKSHKQLISLFTTERRHKIIKRHLVDRHILRSFETGVMEEITAHHKADLMEHAFDRGVLVHPVMPKPAMAKALRPKFPGATSMLASRQLKAASGVIITAGDVVLCRYQGERRVGEVWFFIEVNGPPASQLACISVWDPAPATSDTKYCETYMKSDSPRLLPTESLGVPCIHLVKHGKVSVLIPAQFRM